MVRGSSSGSGWREWGIREPAGDVLPVVKISELISPGALAALGMIVGLSVASAGDGEEGRRVLFDFAEAGAGSDVSWRAVNDGVMGGLSEGDMKVSDGILNFSGVLSLENNGGFSSLRTVDGKFDFSDSAGVVLRVKGDGRTYQVRLESDARLRERWPVSFRGEFATVAGEWTEVKVPFSALKAGWRGMQMDSVFNPAAVQLVGIVVADKKPGAFELEVDWLGVYKETASKK